MSYLFEIDDDEVWAPGNRTAQVYLGLLETAARLVGRPTGLIDKGSGDWFEVDPVVYPALISSLLREFTVSGSWQFRHMVGGLLGVSIAILDRAGIELEARTKEERTAVAELRDAAF